MDIQYLKLLALKKCWVLVEGKYLVYIHNTTFKIRNNKVATFKWNGEHALTRIFELNNIGRILLLNDVRVINPEHLPAVLNIVMQQVDNSGNGLSPRILFNSKKGFNPHYRGTNDESVSLNQYSELAKCSKMAYLRFKDGNDWKILNGQTGCIEKMTPENQSGFSYSYTPNSHEPDISAARSECTAIRLRENLDLPSYFTSTVNSAIGVKTKLGALSDEPEKLLYELGKQYIHGVFNLGLAQKTVLDLKGLFIEAENGAENGAEKLQSENTHINQEPVIKESLRGIIPKLPNLEGMEKTQTGFTPYSNLKLEFTPSEKPAEKPAEKPSVEDRLSAVLPFQIDLTLMDLSNALVAIEKPLRELGEKLKKLAEAEK